MKGAPNENGEILFTHAETTEQATFKFGGQKAGIESTLDSEGKEEESAEEFHVLGFTT